jgi:hypothetical protein
MPAAPTEKKVTVVAKLPEKNSDQILRGRTLVLNRLANATMFASLGPATTVMTTDINTYETAESLVETRVLGGVNARNIAKDTFEKDVNSWVAGTQILVNAAPNYLAAIAIPQALGLYVKVNGVYVKPPFELRNPSAGILEMIKKKIPGTINEYQISYDLGVTWIGLVSTDQNKMIHGGLTVGANIFCRTRANLGLAAGVWVNDNITITM